MASTRKAQAPRSPAKTKMRPLERRRSMFLVGGALCLSAFMLVAWFPASAILAQRQALSSSTDQLNKMKQQDRALAQEKARLTSPAEISRLARQEYQLVEPGQRLVQILPPSGTPAQTGAGQAPFPGDPGLTRPVRPSATALLPNDVATTTTPATSTSSPNTRSDQQTSSAKRGAKGLWQRIVTTLNFWHK